MRLGPVLMGVAVLVAASIGAGLATPVPAVGSDDDTSGSNETNDTMGAAVSSYVHAQSGKTDGAVEQGMWNASFSRNRTPEAVEARAAAMDRRLDRLERRRERLKAAYENGSITAVQYRARMARLEARLIALDHAVNDTAGAARAVGANVSRLRGLGREVAAERARIPDGVGPEGTPPGQAANRTPPGKSDSRTPPGKSSNRTPPGQSENRTPPGKAENQTPPGQSGNGTPPGQSANRTPPGQSGNGTPPGQSANRTPSGHADDRTGSGNRSNATATPASRNGTASPANESVSSGWGSQPTGTDGGPTPPVVATRNATAGDVNRAPASRRE